MGFYFDLFEQYLKSSNLKSDFDDDDRFWVYNFTKQWVEVGGIYFLHHQKKLIVYLNLVSKYSCFTELEDDFEEMTQENYQLHIAAFLILTQMRLVWAANEKCPWEVAFYVSEVPSIITYLHAWQELLRAHWDGQPIEDAVTINLEDLVKSNLARKSAYKRHQKNYEKKERAIELYEKNKNRYKSRANAADKIAQQMTSENLSVEQRTVDKWIRDYLMQSASKL